jgi:hypothetical protein
VHGIAAEIGTCVVAFIEDTCHPVAQSGRFGGGFQVVGRGEYQYEFAEYSTEDAALGAVDFEVLTTIENLLPFELTLRFPAICWNHSGWLDFEIYLA